MPRIIAEDLCIGCGACEYECPVAAIEFGVTYIIDPELCIDCGKCQKVCTSEAIFTHKDVLPKL